MFIIASIPTHLFICVLLSAIIFDIQSLELAEPGYNKLDIREKTPQIRFIDNESIETHQLNSDAFESFPAVFVALRAAFCSQ